MMVNEALPQYTRLHGKLKEWADPIMDVTGLWQGSWELFGPEPDHVNVRIGAYIRWKDGSKTFWYQPNWHEMTPWQKSRVFREMSYYDNLWRNSNSAAWKPFCEKLAETESAKSELEIEYILLFQDRDVIPAPTPQTWREAYAPPQYTPEARTLIYKWSPEESHAQ